VGSSVGRGGGSRKLLAAVVMGGYRRKGGGGINRTKRDLEGGWFESTSDLPSRGEEYGKENGEGTAGPSFLGSSGKQTTTKEGG